MMKPLQYERYIRELAQKTARIGPTTAIVAMFSIFLFYGLDVYDLELKGTLPWRGLGLAGAVALLIGQFLPVKTPRFIIFLHTLMLSGFILMMNGITYLIFTSPDVTPKQEFAVTVGCITVWLVIAMIASGARRYMVYSGAVLMGGLAIFLLLSPAESFGYVVSIYLTALFALLVMRNQEKQERQKASIVYQLEEREKKIALQSQELQNMNEDLVSFNYAITHDLKGPLRLAQSFTQLLERRWRSGELEEESASEFFQQIKGSHSKIYQIIEGLLLLSRIGKSGLEVKEVDLEPIVRGIWEEQAAGKQPEEVPELSIQELGKVQADAKLLWHLLSNLVSNAVKYSRHATAPRVEVGVYREGEDKVLYVRDNGVGFDMQFASDLGKPFKRLHSAHHFEGTGVGLAIVGQVAKLHHGRFWAEGAEGQGATFYCAFPCPVTAGETSH